MMRTMADYAEAYVKNYGMALVPLPPRTKRPLAQDWGKNVIIDPAAARDYYTHNPDWNMGAALGPSRLCSLDIDDIDATRMIFDEFGWDLETIKSEHPTIQGAPGGFRVMFRVPDDMQLVYHALTWPKPDNQTGRFTVWEIRAADEQQRQDVLPPSIHPDTQKPYTWLTRPADVGGFKAPPQFLLQLWMNWDALKPQLQAVCPWKTEVPRSAHTPSRTQHQGDSVIDAYNQATAIEQALAQYGYKRQGKRHLSPNSQTGLAGVIVWTESNKCYIHHASDPLCSDESGHPVGPFDLFAYYEHGGDMKKAAKAAAEQLGMDQNREINKCTRVVQETCESIHFESTKSDLPNNKNQIEPLDIFAEFPVPPIKRDMLPKVIGDYAFDQGQLVGVDPAMIAIPALVACAAALHDDIKIQPKRHETGWTESARLWCAIVGSPSVKKTPAIKRATKRLRKIDHDLHEDNAKAIAQYAKLLEEYKEAKKEAKKTGQSVKAPEPPPMNRMVVEDITVEALSEVLKSNSRGVMCIQDELSGWFGSMDAYTGGKSGNKDRAHWLEAYNGGGRVVDRVMRGTVKIPNWSVSMIGGIQPDAIRRIAANMTDDGLMQRFMIIIGSNCRELDQPEDIEAHRGFSRLVDHLYGVTGGTHAVTLSEDAHVIREALGEFVTDLINYPALPGGLRSHLGKWSGLFARLLLIYHTIECASRQEHPSASQVSKATAERVATLMQRYLLPHALAYYTDILGAASDLEHARWIAGHILSKTLDMVNNRDLMQHYKQWRGLDEWRRIRIMQMLEDMGWITPMELEKSKRRGATNWAVNMRVHGLFSAKAQLETEKRTRIHQELQSLREGANPYNSVNNDNKTL